MRADRGEARDRTPSRNSAARMPECPSENAIAASLRFLAHLHVRPASIVRLSSKGRTQDKWPRMEDLDRAPRLLPGPDVATNARAPAALAAGAPISTANPRVRDSSFGS